MPHHSHRNLRLYAAYAMLNACYFWLPIFFLYFQERVSLVEILRLEAIYYVCVVAFEVPSGYISDRYGRKLTLLVASFAFTISYALFFGGTSFSELAAAQALLGLGFAFNSGTDAAFHADALEEVGRGGEFGVREARLRSFAYLCGAVAILSGAGVAAVETRFAYALNALTAVVSLAVVCFFREPKRVRGDQALDSLRGFVSQVRDCRLDLRVPAITWIAAYAVFMTVLNHIPYEFYQSRVRTWVESTPHLASVVSGLIMAVGQIAASGGSHVSFSLARRFGERFTLLSMAAMQTVIIALMSVVVHPIIAALILLRGVPDAVSQPLLLSRIASHVPSRRRATFFSLLSLGGRLLFSLWLLMMSWVLSLVQFQDPVSDSLLVGAVCGVVGVLLLTRSRRRGTGGDGGAFA